MKLSTGTQSWSCALRVAERIVHQVKPGHPADAMMRKELRLCRDLSPKEVRQVVRSVFAYYRWHGWLNTEKPHQAQVRQALELAQTFAREPKSFADADLITRAVPSWTAEEMEITPAFVRALQSEPRLWLRAPKGHGMPLAKRLGDCHIFGSGLLSDILEYRGEVDLFRTTEFHHGEFELQDISSQAVGLICAPKPGETWWDACAGEGGKLLHLSQLMENKGLLWASDRAEWRLRILKRRAARAGVFNYRSAPWSGGPKLPTKTRFDGVLIDAPCSGSGTWQRNPDGRWTARLQDVQELSKLQGGLLVNASSAVKPGGKLIYAVCSLMRSETAAVAEAFEKQFPEFEPLKLADPLSPGSSPQFRLQLWPQDHHGNGMFIAAWRRKSRC